MVVHCCFDTRGGGVRALYGVGLQGIKNYIIDLLGFGVIFHSPIFIGGWYLTAIVIYYFLFPILYYATKKFRVLFLIITYTPWIYYIVMNDIDMHTDWWLFYVFSFALGIYLSQMEILNNRKRSIMSTLTNARPLTWPAVLVSPACEFRPVISVTMEADLPEMTGRFDPYISEAR